MLRDSDGALNDFNRAANLSPKSAHIYFNRANLHASMKHYVEAEVDYSKGMCVNILLVMIFGSIINQIFLNSRENLQLVSGSSCSGN